MKVKGFFEADSCTWSYLLADDVAGRAALIDPVWEYDPASGVARTDHVDRMLAFAAGRGWSLTHVLETHAHADHLSCAGYVRERTGARVFVGRDICRVQAHFAGVFGLKDFPSDGRQFDGLLVEGDVLPIGDLPVRVLETPGHTPDSLTYLVKDAAFVGDTVFAPSGGTARCDFPGGDAGVLYDSIARLHALPPLTRLFLCHDYPEPGEKAVNCVTVECSRKENIHLRDGMGREAFIDLRRARDAEMPMPRLMYPALQVNIRGGRAPRPDREGRRYLHIPFREAPPAGNG